MKYQLYEYFVEYYSDVKKLDDYTKEKILNHLDWVNLKSNTKLAYGIFDKNIIKSERFKLLDNMMISLMFLDKEPIAFSYQYFLNFRVENKPVIHQGLTVSYKNPGRDITFMNKISCKLFYEQYGCFYTTALSSAPFFIGEISRFFSNIWPSPYAQKQKNPPEKEYKNIAQECFSKYVMPFFPFPDQLELDIKRFVLISKAQEMGFEVDMRKMQRDDELNVNLFSMFWLNYDKQEVLLQVGQFDKESYERFNQIYNQVPINIICKD